MDNFTVIEWLVILNGNQVSTECCCIIKETDETSNGECISISLSVRLPNHNLSEISNIQIIPFEIEPSISSSLFSGRIPITTKDGSIIYAEKEVKNNSLVGFRYESQLKLKSNEKADSRKRK